MTENFQKPKKIVERRCVGCGERFQKRELIRVVRTPEGKIELDFTGKKSGRGAYLCASVSCFKKARRAKRLSQNLDCAIPDEIYDSLEEEIAQRSALEE